MGWPNERKEILMKILVNGPSVARGNGSWPYILQDQIGCDIVNLAQAGCGNEYIYATTISELAQRQYDLVIVMWTDFRRMDVKVKDIKQFADTIYTSEYQSLQNDWPGKIIFPVNDQDYVEKDWIFGCGYINNHGESVKKFFGEFYKHTDYESHYYRSLTKILGLQSILKSMNQPYLFCSVREIKDLKSHSHIYNLLDQTAMIGQTPHKIAGEINSWADETHPGPEAHTEFVKSIISNLKERNLL